ncbi:hypothetical protein [Nonomuraea recticatena]|uniref:hypothetical protein n=1 Tax=Nonomuraea recticatena TaxID=46178 RepID=UPI0036218308
MCLWQSSDRKYHCIDGSGKSVDPPGGICQPGRNPHYACADDQVVSVITPEIGEPTSSPPHTRSTIPPTLSSHPAPADPTIQPTQELMVTSPSPISTPTATPTQTATIDPVAQALEQARTQGLRIWLETDLFKAWKRGPEQLSGHREAQAVRQPVGGRWCEVRLRPRAQGIR